MLFQNGECATDLRNAFHCCVIILRIVLHFLHANKSAFASNAYGKLFFVIKRWLLNKVFDRLYKSTALVSLVFMLCVWKKLSHVKLSSILLFLGYVFNCFGKLKLAILDHV